MKVLNKGVEITRDEKGRKVVRELLDIACDDQAEEKRVEAALKACMEKTIKEAEEAAGRR